MTSYSPMEIRGAILRAADRIERQPHRYDFNNIDVPKGDCGTAHCMLGWIGFDLGCPTHLSHKVANLIEGVDVHDPLFNDNAGKLYRFCSARDKAMGFYAGKFQSDALLAAGHLRAFADARFPATTPAVVVAEDRQLVPWSACAWRPNSVQVAS